MDEIYRSQFRLPYWLYEQLKASADANHRSVNAELVARLEASLAIEEAMGEIAPGAPLYEAKQLLVDLAQERDEALDEHHQLRTAAHSRELLEHLSYNDARLDKIESRIEYMIDQFKLLQKK